MPACIAMLQRRYLAYLTFPLAACGLGLGIVLAWQGATAAWVTLVLLVLEISLSFDNAIVNARVLERLTPSQQRFFLTWGLVIPVFGVRFAGPLLMVSLAGGVGFGEAFSAALHEPQRYRELLAQAYQDFVQSDAATEKVFKVFQDAGGQQHVSLSKLRDSLAERRESAPAATPSANLRAA